MDLIKKLTGKNPEDYTFVAKSLVDNADVDLFAKLVKQDDFLFDFIKNNVAKRIQDACNKDNYLNLLKFLDYYSSSYDTMIARVLYSFGGEELLSEMKEIFLSGNDANKAYAVKYFSFVSKYALNEIIPLLRKTAYSDFEPLATNSAEVLSAMNDEESKKEALAKLASKDEFEQFDGIKFLTAYQAKDAVDAIIDAMKKSSFSENIAAELPYLTSFEELYDINKESALLVLCYIINAIPDIIPITAISDYDLTTVFDKILSDDLTSAGAVVLRLAKEKFHEFMLNDEYLFDADKNTKDAVSEINRMFSKLNNRKLESLLYDELYEGSDFVFFALDFVDEVCELEALLDCENQTLVLKVLTILKEKGFLIPQHKELALNCVTCESIKSVIDAL